MAWNLTDKLATVEAGDFEGSFDLEQPWAGMKVSRGDRVVAEHLFACLVPSSPIETWVRGDDLFCRYPPRNSDLVSYQTYHRLTPERDGIEFILSAQTSLLESAPLTQVTATFAASDLWVKPSISDPFQQVTSSTEYDLRNPPGLFLLRPNDTPDLTWALFVHPADFHRALVRVEPDSSVAFWVFPNSLEKGVIRRAQFALRQLKRGDDEEAAMDLLAKSVMAPPPLTT